MLPPIAMLHHVSDDPAHESLKPYSITRRSFTRLLDYLQRHDYNTVTFAELKKPGKKQVILSFDDCPKHLLDFAVPELLRRGMKGVFYMPAAHLGGYNSWDVEEGRARVDLMDAADLQQLEKLGMEIGGHSWHHIRLKDANNAAEEVQQCRKILERIVSGPLLSFAWPFGSVPANHRHLLTDAGFKYGLSIYQPFETRQALRRFIYHDGDTDSTLERKLSFVYKVYRLLTDPLKKY
ncbi:MAG TPA: polysaccharide deacetylase family protein [Puia sp.]|uniref:polysaccharide deacetylase family protein n=1 Tax=Puia sp. TaxID=2045100 RepID=UPI002C71E2B8|nr:polysaccharide deacetylase family protein [Puia sp.]HVU98942.1 polysaccharide deacetylase family protein [Puia sp.]